MLYPNTERTLLNRAVIAAALVVGVLLGYFASASGLMAWRTSSGGPDVWESFIADGCKETWSIAIWDCDGAAAADGLPDLKSPSLMCTFSTIDAAAAMDSRCVTWSTLATIHPLDSKTARLESVDPSGSPQNHYIRLAAGMGEMRIEYFATEAFRDPILTGVLTKSRLYRRTSR
jgi:hypothetical protein